MSQREAATVQSQSGLRVAFFGGSFDPPHLGHLAVARAARTALRLDRVLFAPVGMQPLKPHGASASYEDRLAMTRLAIAGDAGFELSQADAPQPAANHTPRPDLPGVFRPNDTRALCPNYTIDTLLALRQRLAPEDALFCLLGADSFFALRQWHRAAEIPFVAHLIVAARPGQPLSGAASNSPADALPAGLKLEAAPSEPASDTDAAVHSFALIDAAGHRALLWLLPGVHVEIGATEIRACLREAQGNPAVCGNRIPAAVRAYIERHGLYRA